MTTKPKKRVMVIISIIAMRAVKAMATTMAITTAIITAMTTIIMITDTITMNLVKAVISMLMQPSCTFLETC